MAEKTAVEKKKKDPTKKLAKRKFAGFPAMKTLAPRLYRDRVKSLYDGPKGAGLAIASLVSMHAPLVGRMFDRREFDGFGVGDRAVEIEDQRVGQHERRRYRRRARSGGRHTGSVTPRDRAGVVLRR